MGDDSPEIAFPEEAGPFFENLSDEEPEPQFEDLSDDEEPEPRFEDLSEDEQEPDPEDLSNDDQPNKASASPSVSKSIKHVKAKKKLERQIYHFTVANEPNITAALKSYAGETNQVAFHLEPWGSEKTKKYSISNTDAFFGTRSKTLNGPDFVEKLRWLLKRSDSFKNTLGDTAERAIEAVFTRPYEFKASQFMTSEQKRENPNTSDESGSDGETNVNETQAEKKEPIDNNNKDSKEIGESSIAEPPVAATVEAPKQAPEQPSSSLEGSSKSVSNDKPSSNPKIVLRISPDMKNLSFSDSFSTPPERRLSTTAGQSSSTATAEKQAPLQVEQIKEEQPIVAVVMEEAVQIVAGTPAGDESDAGDDSPEYMADGTNPRFSEGRPPTLGLSEIHHVVKLKKNVRVVTDDEDDYVDEEEDEECYDGSTDDGRKPSSSRQKKKKMNKKFIKKRVVPKRSKKVQNGEGSSSSSVVDVVRKDLVVEQPTNNHEAAPEEQMDIQIENQQPIDLDVVPEQVIPEPIETPAVVNSTNAVSVVQTPPTRKEERKKPSIIETVDRLHQIKETEKALEKNNSRASSSYASSSSSSSSAVAAIPQESVVAKPRINRRKPAKNVNKSTSSSSRFLKKFQVTVQDNGLIKVEELYKLNNFNAKMQIDEISNEIIQSNFVVPQVSYFPKRTTGITRGMLDITDREVYGEKFDALFESKINMAEYEKMGKYVNNRFQYLRCGSFLYGEIVEPSDRPNEKDYKPNGNNEVQYANGDLEKVSIEDCGTAMDQNYKKLILGQLVWCRFQKTYWPAVIIGFETTAFTSNPLVKRETFQPLKLSDDCLEEAKLPHFAKLKRDFNLPEIDDCEELVIHVRYGEERYHHRIEEVEHFDFSFSSRFEPSKNDLKYQQAVAQAIHRHGGIGFYEEFLSEPVIKILRDFGLEFNYLPPYFKAKFDGRTRSFENLPDPLTLSELRMKREILSNPSKFGFENTLLLVDKNEKILSPIPLCKLNPRELEVESNNQFNANVDLFCLVKWLEEHRDVAIRDLKIYHPSPLVRQLMLQSVESAHEDLYELMLTRYEARTSKCCRIGEKARKYPHLNHSFPTYENEIDDIDDKTFKPVYKSYVPNPRAQHYPMYIRHLLSKGQTLPDYLLREAMLLDKEAEAKREIHKEQKSNRTEYEKKLAEENKKKLEKVVEVVETQKRRRSPVRERVEKRRRISAAQNNK